MFHPRAIAHVDEGDEGFVRRGKYWSVEIIDQDGLLVRSCTSMREGHQDDILWAAGAVVNAICLAIHYNTLMSYDEAYAGIADVMWFHRFDERGESKTRPG